MQPPSEAPQAQIETLMVVLTDMTEAPKAAAVIGKVSGVKKVALDEKMGCVITADCGKAKAVADALKAAGIQASVWVKQS